MDVRVSLIYCAFIKLTVSLTYDNVTLPPALSQLIDFKRNHKTPIGLLTTSSGEPVDIRSTFLLNTDQFSNQFNIDLHTTLAGERIPERLVHAKGTGAEGYFEVTHDISNYTSADVFNTIGKKTPLVVRFSTSIPSQSGTDLYREFKAMSLKFYTKEGNLDFLCLQTPVYLYKDPINFAPLVHTFKKNPRTNLYDQTAMWDFITLKPENFHALFWLQSDYGVPNGYRRMDGFPIHAYELSNDKGERHYVRFSFRTEQGLQNLTNAQIANIQSRDLDYFIRDLYNAISRNEFPSWRLEMDVLTREDLKKIDYDPFDVTKVWKNGTYTTVPIGRVVLNKLPDNQFRTIEQSAFNPGNLVPGIPGPVDFMFKSRRVVYRDAQNHRLGRNHNKIEVNRPLYANTYTRDGVPPVKDNMQDVPNYYPNSFSGPVPFVDDKKPVEKLIVLQNNVADLQPVADFYEQVLVDDGQRRRLAENLVISLSSVTPPVQERAIKFMYLINEELGIRVETGLRDALAAARANQTV